MDRYTTRQTSTGTKVIDNRCQMVTTEYSGKGAAASAREHAKMLNDASK